MSQGLFKKGAIELVHVFDCVCVHYRANGSASNGCKLETMVKKSPRGVVGKLVSEHQRRVRGSAASGSDIESTSVCDSDDDEDGDDGDNCSSRLGSTTTEQSDLRYGRRRRHRHQRRRPPAAVSHFFILLCGLFIGVVSFNISFNLISSLLKF